MRLKRIAATSCVLTMLLAASLPSSSTSENLRENAFSIQFGGLERTYRIHVPHSYDGRKQVPLLIALHGGGGTGERMEKLTLGGFNRLADKEGFIVVYPDGVERHWNDGRNITRYRAHREKIDDVGFLAKLIEHLKTNFSIDPKRIFATGVSNGAMMSHRLACELSEKIAAIAPVAGAIPEALSRNCKPSGPMSVLIISNTKDPMVPWEGGEVHFGERKLGRVLSVPDSVKYWVTHNNCAPVPGITIEPDKDPSDGTRVRKEVYTGGRDGTEVILYAIEGGGHTWPGGRQYMPESIVGKNSRDIDASEIIWDFFKKHPKKTFLCGIHVSSIH